MRRPITRILPVLSALAALTVPAVVSAHGVSNDPSLMHACVRAERGGEVEGLVRLVPAVPRDRGDNCARHEVQVHWSIMGPRGDAGPAGPQGPPGPLGPQGPSGTTGQAAVTLASVSPVDLPVGPSAAIPGLTFSLDLTSSNAVVLSTDGGMSIVRGQCACGAVVDIAIEDTFNGSTTILTARRYGLASGGNGPSIGNWSMTVAPTLAPGLHTFTVVATNVDSLPENLLVHVADSSNGVMRGTLTLLQLDK